MEGVMDRISEQAAFYRAYLPHDRGLIPMAVAVSTILALWVFLYLVNAIGPAPEPGAARAGERAAAVLVSRPVIH
jgi:hypothetical protein